jgi:hypothetical protein
MRTLDRKITIVKDNEEIIDFAEPTFVPDFNKEGFMVKRVIVVSEDYDRRPDLISLASYNTVDKMDILLKMNEVSDPLSIRSGDYLIVVDDDGANSFYVSPEKERQEEKKDFVDNTKKSKKDANRLKVLAKISASVKNGSAANVKTAELKPGEVNIRIDDSTNTINL